MRLSERQRDVLEALSAGGPMTAREVGEVFRHDPAKTWVDYSAEGMGQTLKRLEARGLVTRRRVQGVIHAAWEWRLVGGR